MDTQEFDQIGLNLAEQQSTSFDKACTAYSLVNLTKLLGGAVDQQQIEELKQEAIAQHPTGLTPIQKSQFLEKFGLQYKYLGNELAEFTDDNSKFMGEFIRVIKQRPISFAISSALSLYRDPRSRDGVSNSGVPKTGHQIVAQYRDERVRIIDPYVPNTGLHSFRTNNMSSVENLLATITSRAAQYFLEQEKKPITRESVRAESIRRLHSSNSGNFINHALTGAEIYTAIPK